MKFQSKTHILNEVRQISDNKTLSQFAKRVCNDSLNDCRVKTKGTDEEILESLKGVRKIILEAAFEDIFGEFYEEDETEDDEEEEEEEEDDSEDCECIEEEE